MSTHEVISKATVGLRSPESLRLEWDEETQRFFINHTKMCLDNWVAMSDDALRALYGMLKVYYEEHDATV